MHPTVRSDRYPAGLLFFLYQSADVGCSLRRVIEPTFIEQRFDERDDGALIVGREIGGAAGPGAGRRAASRDRRAPAPALRARRS